MPVVRPPELQPPEEITRPARPVVEVVAQTPATIVGELVQRDTVQRTEDEDENEVVDMSDLARRVYPLIKRLIAVERERMPGRLS